MKKKIIKLMNIYLVIQFFPLRFFFSVRTTVEDTMVHPSCTHYEEVRTIESFPSIVIRENNRIFC